MAFLWLIRRQRKSATSPHTLLSGITFVALGLGEGVQGTQLIMDWIILASREAWPNEGDLPEHMGPWESIEEVQLSLRDLRMRHANYVSV